MAAGARFALPQPPNSPIEVCRTPRTDRNVCPPPLDRQECLSSLPTSAPGAAASTTTLPHPPPCFPAGAGSPPGQSELGVEVEGPASACPRLPMLPEHPAQKPHPVEAHQTAVAADRMDEPAQGRKIPRKPGRNPLRRLPGETIRAIDAGLARARHLGGSTLATTRFYRTPPLSAGAGFGPFHCLRPAAKGRSEGATVPDDNDASIACAAWCFNRNPLPVLDYTAMEGVTPLV
jgi:hypothetical protein